MWSTSAFLKSGELFKSYPQKCIRFSGGVCVCGGGLNLGSIHPTEHHTWCENNVYFCLWCDINLGQSLSFERMFECMIKWIFSVRTYSLHTYSVRWLMMMGEKDRKKTRRWKTLCPHAWVYWTYSITGPSVALYDMPGMSVYSLWKDWQNPWLSPWPWSPPPTPPPHLHPLGGGGGGY